LTTSATGVVADFLGDIAGALGAAGGVGATSTPDAPPPSPHPEVPEISIQKQAGHVEGTPQHTNRTSVGKPTSTFFGPESGERLTKEAFKRGAPVPGRPGVREHDFGFTTGTGPGGGMQSKVRVHQDATGRIHGHPSGPERR
jgi:hypothetical protein